MLKVIIIDRCRYCNGEAYIFVGEYKDDDGKRPVYRPCPIRNNSGEMKKQVTLRASQDLPDRAAAIEIQLA